jgi:hypothetical protein
MAGLPSAMVSSNDFVVTVPSAALIQRARPRKSKFPELVP